MPRSPRHATSADQRLTYVAIAAVENCLVAAAVLADAREGLDDAQTELLALLALVDGDVLDVADAAEPAQELALDEDGADRDDAVRRLVDDHDPVVRARGRAQRVELRDPRLLARVRHDREHREHGEVPAPVVGRREGPDLRGRSARAVQNVSRRTYVEVGVQLLAHVRGDVLGGEQEVQFVVRSERHDYWV